MRTKVTLMCLVVLLAWAVSASAASAENAARADIPSGENGRCLACHTDAGHLMQVVQPPAGQSDSSCAAAPSRPPFLDAFVNATFSDSVHGKFGCTGCHGGNAKTDDPAQAHVGMTSAGETCASCHAEISDRHATSLHATLGGMAHALKLRSGEANFHKLNPMWESDCASCHAGCSDCHVTLPKAIGGGLIKGHQFFKRPPMADTCAVCHGSRAGGEYLGHFEDIAPDVHFEAGMHCLDCHQNDLHGDGKTYSDRWQVAGKPSCTDCHPALPNDKARAHNAKHADVSCQVCHSQPYQNCFECHSTVKDGVYERSAGRKTLDFKIGRNTVEGYPYGIVTLRSNPLARDTFKHFGPDLLSNFDDYPTWKTIAPHNIRRIPEQSQSCKGCHENEALYLREGDLDPHGAAANRNALMPTQQERDQEQNRKNAP